MLRSAVIAVRSAALLPEYSRQLNFVHVSRLFGTQFACRNQSSPNANSATDASSEKKNSESEKKAAESTEETTGKGNDRLLEEKQALIKDLEDKYKRSLADNENILTRSRKQIDEARLFGIQTFSKDLLEVADVLQKATESVPQEELDKNVFLKNLYDGLLMTDVQLQKVFKKNGLEKINPVDEKFDPYSHEALFQMEFPAKEAGTVAVVEKVGYKLKGRTLRPALVGVVKGKSA